jgi:hypothetical protein
MTHFTIDSDNNITAHATAAEAKALLSVERFGNEGALAKLAADWPATRLVEIYNGLTGVTPVTKFKDRKTAATRIWKAIQPLGQLVSSGEAQEVPTQDEPQLEPATEVVAIPKQPDGGSGGRARIGTDHGSSHASAPDARRRAGGSAREEEGSPREESAGCH